MSDNEKLRRLRMFVHNYRIEPLQPAGGWCALGYVIEEIDRLLTEPEPRGIFLPLHDAPEYPDFTATFYRTKPREPLAELVARLHGFVGPDGRGRT